MAYTKTTWEKNKTVISAALLNKMEDGIAANDAAVTAIQTDTAAAVQALRTDYADNALRTDVGLTWRTGGYAIIFESSAGTPGDMVKVSNTAYAVTDFIHIPQVASGASIRTNCGMTGDYCAIAWYNNNKVYISGSRNTQASSDGYMTKSIPSNAVYFRLGNNNGITPLSSTYIQFSSKSYGASLNAANQRTMFDQIRNMVALETDGISESLAGKASASDVTALSQAVEGKAEASAVTALETAFTALGLAMVDGKLCVKVERS